MTLKVIVATLALTLGGLALAQTATPGVDKREANQQARIEQGVASGQLTAKEANRMEVREGKLQANEAAAKADGVVTAEERKKLQAQAKRDSAAIHRQKHDAQTQPK